MLSLYFRFSSDFLHKLSAYLPFSLIFALPSLFVSPSLVVILLCLSFGVSSLCLGFWVSELKLTPPCHYRPILTMYKSVVLLLAGCRTTRRISWGSIENRVSLFLDPGLAFVSIGGVFHFIFRIPSADVFCDQPRILRMSYSSTTRVIWAYTHPYLRSRFVSFLPLQTLEY